jgi:hypothetical protein
MDFDAAVVGLALPHDFRRNASVGGLGFASLLPVTGRR